MLSLPVADLVTRTRAPTRCAGCERDIIPGDVLAQVDGQSIHYACAPTEEPRTKLNLMGWFQSK